MGNSFGRMFAVTTFGESHGACIGAVIDGCPAGLALASCDFISDMMRRRPGRPGPGSFGSIVSERQEEDVVQILSGVFEGTTLGTPITLLIENKDARSEDYEALKYVERVGHGDFTYAAKFGVRDYRGGGRASGRETAARVAAGVVAKKILGSLGILVAGSVESIGFSACSDSFGLSDNFGCSDSFGLEEIINSGDSIGSSVACKIFGIKAGVGEPVFDKLTAELAKAVMSIGGAKGVEFGMGFKAAEMKGSEHNLANQGGILAGISDGNEINLKVSFKPPSSVGIGGRHDAAIAPRASVVVEAMVAMVLVDHVFRGFCDNMDAVKRNYAGA